MGAHNELMLKKINNLFFLEKGLDSLGTENLA
jgi:hypothetical protein